MKRKLQRGIVLLLSCLMVLFAIYGCGNKITHTSTTDAALDPESSEDDTISDLPEDLRYDTANWPKLQHYIQTPIVEKDVEGYVYISLMNQDCDFYPGAVYNGVAFDIITREYFKPSDIKIEFTGKTKCEIRVTERNEEFQHIALNTATGNYNIDGQQPYHYLCIQNVDLKTLGQKNSDARYAADAYAALLQNGYANANDYAALVEKYVEPYTNLFQNYISSYANQKPRQVTDYNAYSVNLIFDQRQYVEETIEYIDVHIGDRTYRVNFGQWRIHENVMAETAQPNKGVALGTVAILGASGNSPYANGYMKVDNAVSFVAQDDIVLRGLRIADNTEAEILGAQVECTNRSNSINYFLSGTDSVKVEKGSKLNMSLYLYSDSFKEYEMSMTSVVYIDYVLASTSAEYTMAIPCKISRYNKLWDTYCLKFLGVDVGEYYHYFGDEIMETCWVSEIPESWQKK